MDVHALLEEYEENHRSLACQITHAIGIPLIVLSLPTFFVNWRRALIFFLAGWALQFLGHTLEGKRPKFFEGAQFLLAGVIWWLRLITAPLRALARR